MKRGERVDAVEMVREIRDQHHELLRDKTPEQRRRFYAEKARALHEKLGLKTEKTKTA